MPEIPEMELYKNNLNATIRGKRIQRIWVYRKKSINCDPESFRKGVGYSSVDFVERKGKYLIFHLSNGLKLLAHMMLDGRLYYLTLENSPLAEEDFEDVELIRKKVKGLSGKPSVLFEFEEGSLLFFCQLTLGYLRLYRENELKPILDELGPDPLDPAFQAEEFSKLLAQASPRGKVKSWLMQQKNLSGVGNAYSNESLFGAGIIPTRSLGAITAAERVKLYYALKGVLQESIRLGGDMKEPFAPDDHFTGGFIPYFRVYERAGKPCVVCGEKIIQEEVGGRNAFYCLQCQS